MLHNCHATLFQIIHFKHWYPVFNIEKANFTWALDSVPLSLKLKSHKVTKCEICSVKKPSCSKTSCDGLSGGIYNITRQAKVWHGESVMSADMNMRQTPDLLI